MRFNVWRRESPRAGDATADRSDEPLAVGEIQQALEARGIPAEFSAGLAAQIEPRAASMDDVARKAMIDGAALALDLQRETGRDLARSLRGLKEVERMMGAFSGELSKLDEVLEVLAAYVRRMKTSGASTPEHNRTLH